MPKKHSAEDEQAQSAAEEKPEVALEPEAENTITVNRPGGFYKKGDIFTVEQLPKKEKPDTPLPTPGRIVHYIDGFTGVTRPAVVASMISASVVDLVVFDIDQNPPIFAVKGAMITDSYEKGHWCWPIR
jgi:hypothetical protein